MYSNERRRKIAKKVETTRTEVTEKKEMQLKMCYRSFKKIRLFFFYNYIYIIGFNLLKLFVIAMSSTKLSDNVFNLSVKESIKLR